MKKLYVGILGLVMSICLIGCSSSVDDQGKVENALDGNVIEVEGQQDQYGWFPHMRLTFDGDALVEVYFDYVDDAGSKKSQDEEYNAGMKEKTGVDTNEAMIALREDLLTKQSPDNLDVIAGATQTSIEFKTMAEAAFEQYSAGGNSANNYNDGNPSTSEDDAKESENSSEGSVIYETGGDGSPNAAENSANMEDSSESKSDSSSSEGEN